MSFLYFDHAAATPLDDRLKLIIDELLTNTWANPSSIHAHGRTAQSYLDTARKTISDILNCKQSEIYFTSSATEANNIVLYTSVQNRLEVLTSTIEHAAIQEPLMNNPTTAWVKPNQGGHIELTSVLESITDTTQLISIQLVNNEIGTIQPLPVIASHIKEINIDRKKKGLPHIYIHTDASQAPVYATVNPTILGVDAMTLSAQKMYGLRGTGVLYVSESLRASGLINPIQLGGGHEKGLRPGTEFVLGAAVVAKALELCEYDRMKDCKTAVIFRDECIANISHIDGFKINGYWVKGDYTKRIANNIHFSIPGDTQQLLTYLDLHGCSVSAGSACSSGAIEYSNVLKEIGLTQQKNRADIRISFGRKNTQEDVTFLIEKIKEYSAKFIS